MTTPRTYIGTEHNDQPRAQRARDVEAEHERSPERGQRDQRGQRSDVAVREREPLPKAEGEERTRLLEDRPFDFIERTRPEDRLDGTSHHGQLTRDNVNPNIPSVKPDQLGPAHDRIRDPGGIVDPRTLGMEGQAGVKPPEPTRQPEQWPGLRSDRETDTQAEAEHKARTGQAKEGSGGLGIDNDPRTHSINEPPGSDVFPNSGDGPNTFPPDEAEPPELLSIDPDVATLGDPDLTMTCTGEDFTPDCVIVFNGGVETTEYISPTELSTIVKPSIAGTAGDVPVLVRSPLGDSDAVMFEFIEPAARETIKHRPKREPRPSKKAAKRKR